MHRLNNGETKSCGCRNRVSGLAGARFGEWTVLEPAKSRNGNTRWKCICDCGKEGTVDSRALIHGTSTSCGNHCIIGEAFGQLIFGGTNIPLIRSKKIWKSNTSGVKGVSRHGNKWAAAIEFRGKYYYLGRHENLQDAAAIRKQAEEKLFGEFIEWYDSQFPKPKSKPNTFATH